MAYKAKVALSTLKDNDSYINYKKNHECVALVQMAGNAPHTSKWKMGIRVLDAPLNTITKGTVIATFDTVTKKYPKTSRHAAFYVSHDATGIWVYDQWNKKGMSTKRKIKLKNLDKRSVNDAKFYYVVE